jgi:hypothetical protein
VRSNKIGRGANERDVPILPVAVGRTIPVSQMVEEGAEYGFLLLQWKLLEWFHQPAYGSCHFPPARVKVNSGAQSPIEFPSSSRVGRRSPLSVEYSPTST